MNEIVIEMREYELAHRDRESKIFFSNLAEECLSLMGEKHFRTEALIKKEPCKECLYKSHFDTYRCIHCRNTKSINFSDRQLPWEIYVIVFDFADVKSYQICKILKDLTLDRYYETILLNYWKNGNASSVLKKGFMGLGVKSEIDDSYSRDYALSIQTCCIRKNKICYTIESVEYVEWCEFDGYTLKAYSLEEYTSQKPLQREEYQYILGFRALKYVAKKLYYRNNLQFSFHAMFHNALLGYYKYQRSKLSDNTYLLYCYILRSELQNMPFQTPSLDILRKNKESLPDIEDCILDLK